MNDGLGTNTAGEVDRLNRITAQYAPSLRAPSIWLAHANGEVRGVFTGELDARRVAMAKGWDVCEVPLPCADLRQWLIDEIDGLHDKA